MVSIMIEKRILSVPSEINLAKKLLYQDYFLDKNWTPKAGNPSGLHINHEEKIYSDNYDSVATWFGVFISGEIIGCCRLCKRLDEMFEIEHYLEHPLPDEIKNEKFANEANRFATHKKFREDFVVFALLTGLIVEYSLGSNIHIFSTTGYNDINRHKKVGYIQCNFPPFQYSKSDPYVHLVYTTTKNEQKQNIVNQCKIIVKAYQKKAPKGYYDSI
jgi:hypothetical protein